MGFYIKKSISFGGLRFNFSKSGVGVSAGFKGLRLGTGPRGNYVHMGRGGLYYRASLGHNRTALKDQTINRPQQPLAQQVDDGLCFQEIESADTELLTDTTSKEIIEDINTKLKKWQFWPFCLLVAFGGSAEYIVGAIVAALICFMIDNHRRKTFIVYDIDEEIEVGSLLWTKKWVHFFGPVNGKTKVDSFIGYAAHLGLIRGGTPSGLYC